MKSYLYLWPVLLVPLLFGSMLWAISSQENGQKRDCQNWGHKYDTLTQIVGEECMVKIGVGPTGSDKVDAYLYIHKEDFLLLKGSLPTSTPAVSAEPAPKPHDWMNEPDTTNVDPQFEVPPCWPAEDPNHCGINMNINGVPYDPSKDKTI